MGGFHGEAALRKFSRVEFWSRCSEDQGKMLGLLQKGSVTRAGGSKQEAERSRRTHTHSLDGCSQQCLWGEVSPTQQSGLKLRAAIRASIGLACWDKTSSR